MTIRHSLIAALLAFGVLAPAAAQNVKEQLATDCARYEKQAEERAKTREAWPSVAQLADAVGARYCSGDLPAERMSVALFEFLSESWRDAESMGINQSIFDWRAQLARAKAVVDVGRPIGNMSTLPPGFGPGLSFHGEAKVANPAACNQVVVAARAANKVKAQDCEELLQLYSDIFEPLQLLVQRSYTREVKAYLSDLQRDWDDFLAKSRSQTWLELPINSAIWRRGKKEGIFLEPPEWQLILLHPSVVLEYVDKGVDGNRFEEGIMIEVFGANRWRNDKWYQPSGASYVLIYAERAGLADWANGVAVHFGNKYTLGATRRHGVTGFFISIDVLELYKDKKKTLDEYKSNLPKWLKAP